MGHPTKDDIAALLADRSEPVIVRDIEHYRYLDRGLTQRC